MFSYAYDRLRFNRFTLLVTFITFILLSSTLGTAAQAATYYLSPSGADSQPGTSASPWKTFVFAIPKLQPGDTLIVRDGTYNGSNSGYLNMDCSTNAKNGTSTQPITVKAENERKAFFQGDGSGAPMQMLKCAYWTLQGLRAEDGDFPSEDGDYAGTPLVIRDSDHITVQRCLVRFTNRYKGGTAMYFRVTNSLIEENELYSYQRHGMQFGHSSNNIVRRNYANSRNYADIPGGYPSANDETSRGDSGFIIYGTDGSDSNLFENNISEGNGGGFYLNAYYDTVSNTRFLGNISLSDSHGLFANGGPYGGSSMPTNTYLENFVVLASRSIGLQMGSVKGLTCKNCAVIGSGDLGSLAYQIASSPGDGVYSFSAANMLSLNNATTGVSIASAIQTWSIDSANAYGNSTDYSPASSSNYTNQKSLDATLGACKVWLPDSSPMKRAGKDGADIGANVLYRYQDGVLTNKPLWDPATGVFPCGTVIAGVNDMPGSSCINVHQRLNVNTNGCAFPSGYNNSSPNNQPPSPGHLRVLSVK